VARRARIGGTGGELPDSRLVHLAPALLGTADSDHLLRSLWGGPGACGRFAGAAAIHRGLQADDSGVSPLARHEEWYRVPCPKCGGPGVARPICFGHVLDSAWYFCAIPAPTVMMSHSTRSSRALAAGGFLHRGNEHAVLHLLYARFVTMALHDAGLLDLRKPFTRFPRATAHCRDGAKMSKTKGNISIPTVQSRSGAADAFRTYLMFLGPYEQGGDFRAPHLRPAAFPDRLWSAVAASTTDGSRTTAFLRELHRTIRKVSETSRVCPTTPPLPRSCVHGTCCGR